MLRWMSIHSNASRAADTHPDNHRFSDHLPPISVRLLHSHLTSKALIGLIISLRSYNEAGEISIHALKGKGILRKHKYVQNYD